MYWTDLGRQQNNLVNSGIWYFVGMSCVPLAPKKQQCSKSHHSLWVIFIKCYANRLGLIKFLLKNLTFTAFHEWFFCHAVISDYYISSKFVSASISIYLSHYYDALKFCSFDYGMCFSFSCYHKWLVQNFCSKVLWGVQNLWTS